MTVVAYCRECYHNSEAIKLYRNLQNLMYGEEFGCSKVFVYEDKEEETGQYRPRLSQVQSIVCENDHHSDRCQVSVIDERGQVNKDDVRREINSSGSQTISELS